MTARYVADEAAMRKARCLCGHGVFGAHRGWGCAGAIGPHACDCDRSTYHALLASNVVQPRDDAVREAKAEVANAFFRWAMKNEVDAAPLDWAWFGEITRRYSPLHEEYTPGTDRPAAEDGPRNTGTGSAT